MVVAGKKETKKKKTKIGERGSLHANENDSVERRIQYKKNGTILEQ